jgi:hypothetical protein
VPVPRRRAWRLSRPAVAAWAGCQSSTRESKMPSSSPSGTNSTRDNWPCPSNSTRSRAISVGAGGVPDATTPGATLHVSQSGTLCTTSAALTRIASATGGASKAPETKRTRRVASGRLIAPVCCLETAAGSPSETAPDSVKERVSSNPSSGCQTPGAVRTSHTTATEWWAGRTGSAATGGALPQASCTLAVQAAAREASSSSNRCLAAGCAAAPAMPKWRLTDVPGSSCAEKPR